MITAIRQPVGRRLQDLKVRWCWSQSRVVLNRYKRRVYAHDKALLQIRRLVPERQRLTATPIKNLHFNWFELQAKQA